MEAELPGWGWSGHQHMLLHRLLTTVCLDPHWGGHICTVSCAGVLEQCRGQSSWLSFTTAANLLAGAAGQQNKSRPAVMYSDLWEVPQPRSTVCPQVQIMQDAGLCTVCARLEA